MNVNYAYGNIQTEKIIIQKYIQNGKDENKNMAIHMSQSYELYLSQRNSGKSHISLKLINCHLKGLHAEKYCSIMGTG
jgi:hypothetical protein